LQPLIAMESDLRVYVLRFAAVGPLTRAFDRIADAPEVASCSFELAQRQVRMLAPPAVGEALIERLYLEGGLAWCSRHRFEEEPPN
jgi:hypothetical protein